MYVQLRFTLPCAPDDAWRALRSVAVLRELYGPALSLYRVSGIEADEWAAGDARFALRLFGVIPLGQQDIVVSFERARSGDVRIFRDSGGAVTGPLALLTGWRHRMAVAADPAHPGHTLYRDRVEFHGPFAAISWPVLWTIWQWRGRRLRSLARTWSTPVPR